MNNLLRRIAGRGLAQTAAPPRQARIALHHERPWMRGLLAILVTFTLATASLLRHAQADGATLLPSCEAAVKLADGDRLDEVDTTQGMYCLGYVAALRDAESLASTLLGIDAAFCASPRVTDEQVARIFLKYVADSPERLHEPARIHMRESLAATFPCPSAFNSSPEQLPP